MGVTSGFFNSKDGDRKYDAEQMSSIFDGLISDGVYAAKSAVIVDGKPANEMFEVIPNGGMTIRVGRGRAWFNHTWTLNDNALTLTVSDAHQTLPRVDAVVIEVNTQEETRANSIKIINGTADSTYPRPKPNSVVDTIHTYPLAYITVEPKTTEITAKDIHPCIGEKDPDNGQIYTPIVTGLVEDGVDIDPLITKWDTAVTDKIQEMDNQVSAKVQELETAISQATSGAVVDGSVKTSSIEDGAVTLDKLAWNAVRIRWTGSVDASGESQGIIVHPADWNSGSTVFPGYPYYAKLDASKLTPGANITQLTSSNGADAMTMYPEVVFHPDAVALGVLAPVCIVRRPSNSATNTYIGIYASSVPAEDVKIISATLWR